MENQLSLSLISLSPLITSHLKILQHLRVQSFHLLIISSLSFGSIFINYINFFTLTLAYKYYSPTHYTKGTITLIALFDYCIKIHFSFYSKTTLTFPSRYFSLSNLNIISRKLTFQLQPKGLLIIT